MEDSRVPQSAALSPSKDTNTFMGAYLAHLQQGNDRKPEIVVESDQIPAKKSKSPREPKAPKVPKSPREPKAPKKPREPKAPKAPRDPSSVKKPREKKIKSTTINLQIQLHDPNTEPSNAMGGAIATDTYAYRHGADNHQLSHAPHDVISNSMVQPAPVSQPIVHYTPIANSMQHLTNIPNANANTNANPHFTPITSIINGTSFYIDDPRNDITDQLIEYEPEPTVYQTHPINGTVTECVSVPNGSHPTLSHPHGDTRGMPHDSYTIPMKEYSELKAGTSLLSHFNLSHPNVSNNSVVCEQTLNPWRAGNEIMLNK